MLKNLFVRKPVPTVEEESEDILGVFADTTKRLRSVNERIDAETLAVEDNITALMERRGALMRRAEQNSRISKRIQEMLS